MNLKELKQQYNESLKSMDTEETIDLWFYRPLGFAWAVLFSKLGIKPNAVTIASIFLGVAGGILLYFGASPLIWLNYVGIFLIIWANTYDSADGQLARLTKQYSQIGRILDGVSGDFWAFAIYFALVFRELHFGDAWLGDFEARFPDTDPPYTDPAQLQEFAAWVVSTDTERATGSTLAEPVTYDGVEYTADTAAYRLAKFKAEAGDYIELQSAMFYYLFTELFLMVDSRAKNMFPSFMGGEATA